MIQTEYFATRADGVELERTYSDAGMMIRQTQTGALYTEAVDVSTSENTYVETDIPIDDDVSDAEALDIILGRGTDEESGRDQA